MTSVRVRLERLVVDRSGFEPLKWMASALSHFEADPSSRFIHRQLSRPQSPIHVMFKLKLKHPPITWGSTSPALLCTGRQVLYCKLHSHTNMWTHHEHLLDKVSPDSFTHHFSFTLTRSSTGKFGVLVSLMCVFFVSANSWGKCLSSLTLTR